MAAVAWPRRWTGVGGAWSTKIYAENRTELEALGDGPRLDRLCELNVIRQVRNVASDVFVQDAWARGQDLSVHGWIYAIHDGLLTDLSVTVSDAAGLEALQPAVIGSGKASGRSAVMQPGRVRTS